jgi:hypothetical protein
MKRITSCLIGLFILYFCSYSQESADSSKIDFTGYISVMPSIFWMGKSGAVGNDSALWQTLLHNRINIQWDLSVHLSGALELRNQVIGGDFVFLANQSSGFKKESYYLPLTFHQAIGNQYILSLSVDRLWFQYTNDKLEIKLGRQRINWGQTFVWNPNDIFNTYNFFDFDYPERPGADAIRIEYYTSQVSSLDFAAKVDSSGNISGGGLYRFTKWSTDFQLLTGILNQRNSVNGSDTMIWNDNDLVFGTGISGSVNGLSLRSELSYFHSLKENADSTNLLLLSLAADYSFANQLYLLFELLYNNNVLLPVESSVSNFYYGSQSVKTLSYSKYNFFAQITYPITPILKSSASGMFFTDEYLKGFYAGPTLELSLGDNLTLSGIYQRITFQTKSPVSGNKMKMTSNYAFARLKWNF